MRIETKLFLIDAAVKLLILGGMVLWVSVIYSLAVSGFSVMRQMLGCMLSTMAIFTVLSLSLKSLKNYRTLLQERQA